MYYFEINSVEYGFCRSENGHYSDKFNRVVKLAQRFSELSSKFDRMMQRGNYCSKQSRLALACKIMMYTGIRIGNESSAEGYMTKPHPFSKKEPEFVQTFGLTTLQNRHLLVKGRSVYMNFVGKKSVENSYKVTGRLATQIKNTLRSFSGNTFLDISVYELTKFVKQSVGRNFTPKDFRTLRANICAYDKLMEITERESPTTKSALRKEIKEITTYVAEQLNNTPGVCKSAYIDDMFWDWVQEIRK